MVHGLIATTKLTSADHLEKFLKRIAPLFEYSNDKAEEPNTLHYELYQNEEEPATVTIVERYTKKNDLMEVHLKSKIFEEFAAWATGAGSALTDPPVEGEDSGIVASISFTHLTTDTIDPTLQPLVNSISEAKKQKKLVAAAVEAEATQKQKSEEAAQSVGDLPFTNGCLVFCGSRAGTDPTYVEHAQRFGEILAENKKPLVYGGGSVGVMGALANAVANNGGVVQGIIPHALTPKECSGGMIGRPIISCDTMSERKGIMFKMSDQVVSLPGGIGTLDELLEVMTLFQLNCYRPKIGLLNTNNFYGPFLSMLEHLTNTGFLNKDALDYLVIETTPEALWEKMQAFTPPPSVADLKWIPNKY